MSYSSLNKFVLTPMSILSIIHIIVVNDYRRENIMNINLTDQISGVRIFHAATIAQPVNIYLQDRLVVEGLNYSEVTNYLPIQRGRNNVKIRNTATGELLYNQTLTLDGNKFITISAIYETGNVDLIVLEDITDTRFNPNFANPYFAIPHNFYQQPMYNPMFQVPQQQVVNPMPQPQYGFGYDGMPQTGMSQLPWQQYPINENKSYACKTCNDRQDENLNYDIGGLPAIPVLGNSARLRFVHLSPNAPAVDLVLANGTRLFTDTRYKQATDYIPIGAGNLTFNVVRFGTNQVLLTVPNLTLLPNESYTIYAIGLLNGSPAFELVLLKDGI
ncbi:MAG: hypothetical protein K0Q49_1834 [Haloplasmataceae bacterium]|jgi:hypothetical protein|nr:hypothetical protein [Haloplasmataceae bacterium]